MTAPITGLILAGGRAMRMGGCDKGLIPLAGHPLAAHALARLRSQVHRVWINANRNQARYAALGAAQVLSDSLDGFQGPLAGMLAGLEALSSDDWLITIPCDSPLLPDVYVERMWQAVQTEHTNIAVASYEQRLEPVFVLMSARLAPHLRQHLEQGERKIDQWLMQHSLSTVEFDDHPEMFHNLNTLEELTALECDWRSGQF